MFFSEPVDGFRLGYDVTGDRDPSDRQAVLLLHGWPGDRTDYRVLAPLLADAFEIVVPDLRGFGDSDRHPADPSEQYDARAQARSIAGLIEQLGLGRPIVAGYDIGSRIAQALATARPELVGGLVVAPPLPGIGDRILDPDTQREFWYQAFHQLRLAETLMDGKPEAVRAYLEHFWTHWSGPDYVPSDQDLDRLARTYGRPGAYTASIAWYRAGAGAVASSLRERTPAPADRLPTPTTVLWPEHDPLFPPAWSDRLHEFFSDVTLIEVDGVGHFAPLEYPERFAAAIRDRAASVRA